MKVLDRVTEEQKQHLERLQSQQKKPPNEELTKEEWEDIMGVHRDTYKRVRGAVRRR